MIKKVLKEQEAYNNCNNKAGKYWRKETHISEIVPKVLKEILDKHISNITVEENF